MEKLLTVQEVAELFGVSRRQVYYLIASENLPVFRIGSRLRFAPAEIRDWMDKRKEAVA